MVPPQYFYSHIPALTHTPTQCASLDTGKHVNTCVHVCAFMCVRVCVHMCVYVSRASTYMQCYICLVPSSHRESCGVGIHTGG